MDIEQSEFESMKKEIEAMSYVDMLRRWRFADNGDPIFRGEIGKFYAQEMEKRKQEVGPVGAVLASKKIGW